MIIMIFLYYSGLSLLEFVGIVLPLLQLYWRWYSPAVTKALQELSDTETYTQLEQDAVTTGGVDSSGPFGSVVEPPTVPMRASSTPESKTTICVTGGCGFLGSAIVRHLQQAGYDVVVVDIRIPSSMSSSQRKSPEVGSVTYHEIDIVSGDLRPIFESVDVVVHTAGVVVLSDNFGLLHNAHIVATRNIVRWARACPRVGALVVSSSSGAVTTPYTSRSQLNLPSDFRPGAEFHFPSHYSKTKYNAEQIALAANDPGNGFAVCALRMPGVYGCYPDGRGDALMVGPLLSGSVTAVPARSGCKVDFCYVENAAHAHVVAVATLLPSPVSAATMPMTTRQRVVTAHARNSRVAGRTFNVSNGECFDDVLHGWNTMLAVCNVQHRIRALPYAVGWAVACVSEFVFWFTAGHVPAPTHAFWNLTRSTLDLSRTSITLSLSKDFPYQPRFDNTASFHDIRKRYRREAHAAPGVRYMDAIKRLLSGTTTAGDVSGTASDPHRCATDDVDWGHRPRRMLLPRSSWLQRGQWTLEVLAGPAPTAWEQWLTVGALVGTLVVMHGSALPTWSSLQYMTAWVLAMINGAAAVQCACGQSKRWYHSNGRLSGRSAGVMLVEVVVQCCIVAWVFSTDPVQYAWRTSVWYLLCLLLILPASMGTLEGSHYTPGVPLHAQRPTGVLLMLASISLLHGPYQLVPHTPGLEWLGIVMPAKYLVSHAVRHEPYRDHYRERNTMVPADKKRT
eukprot:m.770047 g.770047  ORF g.770047 m.770047 type:complete len:733 (+) comp23238_c3_seq12:443-2641(+)